MRFYSTNNRDLTVDLRQAVTQGLADDNGLYLPAHIPALPGSFFQGIESLSFPEIAFSVASNLLGDDIPGDELKRIVDHTIQFDAPVVALEDDIYALELFHGPTMAFKDFGARFMSQLLGYYARQQEKEIVILVATSGDTGSAVANGFLEVPGIRVVVLYPSGKVSDIQEKQFTTLGQNITALEIDGTFDDCQRLVKEAFLDAELRSKFFLTSANSINIARLIPQSFYYFHAYAQLKARQKPLVFAIPSGNFGNITGGLLAQRMGLPIHHFVAATNRNDVFPAYLETGLFQPRPSEQTISNAMDVGDPSNFVRILDLFDGDYGAIRSAISGYAFSDAETRAVMKDVFFRIGYVLDPHGAIGYLGLKKYLSNQRDSLTGVFLETAHPAKFKDVVEDTLESTIPIPDTLQRFLKLRKKTTVLAADYAVFKDFLANDF
jgi:threonine synthase